MLFGKKDDQAPDTLRLALLPLREVVVFPYMVIPLFVGRDRSMRALEWAIKSGARIFLASQKDSQQTSPRAEDIYRVGAVARIIQMLKLPDNTIKVFVEGKWRARIVEFLDCAEFFRVQVDPLPDQVQEREAEIRALMRGLKGVFETYAGANRLAPDFISNVREMNDPGRLTDALAAQLQLKVERKQDLLECVSVGARMEKLLEIMQAEIEIAQIDKTIRDRVKKQMEKNQKEYYLTEQIRAIREEIGEKDDEKSETAELDEQLTQKNLPVHAEAKVRKELRKLRLMSPLSAEASIVRNYIDWFIALPWTELSEGDVDIVEARKILDEDHYGLREVKERIVEFLAVQKLSEKPQGPILCLVGPPGVGKTSLARSVARAVHREFIRISLGGVRDEAEIRGHRRTYVGALPGKIIQSMKKVSTINPVMLLDEVDKMSTDFRGNPSAALLEVLDPEQNHAFNDHYLDVDYDLSKVMFVTTANTLHGIPSPLQDRMEIIRLPGYTEAEKLRIGRRFLAPKQLEANGLAGRDIEFPVKALVRIIRRYTREAGVRELERQVAKILRKLACDVVTGKVEGPVPIDASRLRRSLGVPRFRHGVRENTEKIGIATGLAWTETGGELLIVEIAVMPGSGKLTVTGKLGEVMQESARASMSYVRTRADSFGLAPDFYDKIDIHIHVPEGAVPKDGPSAGVTMTTAITSALTRKPVPNDLAMTGEITLRGRVLPIGGLKEKLLAAKRGLMTKVLIPKENEKDLREVAPKIRKGLEIIPVDHMDEVIRVVFGEMHPAAIFQAPAAADPPAVFTQ